MEVKWGALHVRSRDLLDVLLPRWCHRIILQDCIDSQLGFKPSLELILALWVRPLRSVDLLVLEVAILVCDKLALKGTALFCSLRAQTLLADGAVVFCSGKERILLGQS